MLKRRVCDAPRMCPAKAGPRTYSAEGLPFPHGAQPRGKREHRSQSYVVCAAPGRLGGGPGDLGWGAVASPPLLRPVSPLACPSARQLFVWLASPPAPAWRARPSLAKRGLSVSADPASLAGRDRLGKEVRLLGRSQSLRAATSEEPEGEGATPARPPRRQPNGLLNAYF